MAERNLLSNGRFAHNLNSWTVSGAVYSAGDGDEHYGVSVLSTGGDYVEQTFAVTAMQTFRLHVSVKAIGAALSGSQCVALITDPDGDTVLSQALSGSADVWTDNNISLGLVPGGTYTLRVTNASATGDVRLDDIWIWHVPVTRLALAQAVERRLGRVATDLELTLTADGDRSEGDYSDSVSRALRSMGALDEDTGLPDIRALDQEMVTPVEDLVLQYMLERASIDYALEVDITMGPHSERMSQKREAIQEIVGGSGGSDGGGGTLGGQIIQRPLNHPRRDFEY